MQIVKKTLLFFASMAILSVPALAQESEISGGGGGTAGAITAGVGSGNAGRVPQFASTTSLEDSKMLTSGTNSGTWTLYDSTADATGVSTFNIRVGEGQDDSVQWYPLMQILNKATGVPIEVLPLVGTGNGLTTQVATGQVVHNASDQLWVLSTTGLLLEQDAIIGWADVYATAARNVGLANPASGILKVTDGSTGSGGIGLSDAATATVTDALILRHATSGTAAASFGTGLLFQGEDAAGNMQDMASIQAIYEDSADGSEDARLRIAMVYGGVPNSELAAFTYTNVGGGLPGIIGQGAFSISSVGDQHLIAGGTQYFYGAGTVRWQNNATAFSPWADNTYDIGAATLKVKDSYLGTSIQGTRTQAISAEGGGGTEFVEIAVASGASVGGFIEYTVQADDGTDREIESGVVSFTATNEAGTEAANVSILGTPAETPGAALTVSFDVTTGLTNVFRVKVISDSPALVPTTHKIEYRVHVNSGTTTVTPLT